MTQFLNPTLYRRAGNHSLAITRNNLESLLDAGQIEVAMRNGKWWRIRRNGRTQTWKRDPNRLRIPFKMGLYGHGAITETDFLSE